MTVFLWSQTPLTNATSDPTINYQEGQAPSTLNDSARAAMAAVAKYRDDQGGLLVTSGTSTAYALSSNENLQNVPTGDTPANVNGFKITFQPHVTNGAAATLSVDSQTAEPLYMNSTTALPAGYFQQNGIYSAVYESSIPAWIVQHIFAPPIAIGNAQAAGTANAQTVTAPGFALTAGYGLIWLPGYANTGALSLNVNGLGSKNVYIQTPTGPIACIGGEVNASQYAICIYDGTEFELIDPSPRVGFGAQATLASASTADLGTIFSHNVQITGTTAITSFGLSASVNAPLFIVSFAASLLLTYNATSLILPGAANIQTQANDYCLALYLGSGNWQVLDYVRAATPLSLAMPAVQGLTIKNDATTPNSKMDITCSSAILTAGGIAGAGFSVGSQSLTANLSTNGANGLDTGSVAASTWYYLYIIYNPSTNTVAALASLSPTAPSLPSGYTQYMRVGAAQTDSSSNLYRTLQKGKEARYQITSSSNTSSFPFTFTGTTSSIWVAKQFTGNGYAAPATAVNGKFALTNYSTGSGATVALAPNGNYSSGASNVTNPAAFADIASSSVICPTMFVDMVLESNSVDYWSSTSSSNAYATVLGWTDSVNAC